MYSLIYKLIIICDIHTQRALKGTTETNLYRNGIAFLHLTEIKLIYLWGRLWYIKASIVNPEAPTKKIPKNIKWNIKGWKELDWYCVFSQKNAHSGFVSHSTYHMIYSRLK